jgi:hypothetical protein
MVHAPPSVREKPYVYNINVDLQYSTVHNYLKILNVQIIIGRNVSVSKTLVYLLNKQR